jgi:hypothetical protein
MIVSTILSVAMPALVWPEPVFGRFMITMLYQTDPLPFSSVLYRVMP